MASQRFITNENINQRFMAKIGANNIGYVLQKIKKKMVDQRFTINNNIDQRFTSNIDISYKLKIHKQQQCNSSWHYWYRF